QKKAAENNAVAFAVGQNVVMGASAPAPGTPHGDALLAHELSHVAQQRDAANDPVARMMPIGGESQAAERDADRGAAQALSAQRVATLGNFAGQVGDVMRTGLQLQRCSSTDASRVEDAGPSAPAKLPPPLNVAFGDDMFVITFAQVGETTKPSLSMSIAYTG